MDFEFRCYVFIYIIMDIKVPCVANGIVILVQVQVSWLGFLVLFANN